MEMSMRQFVARQDEFMGRGYTVEMVTRWKDGQYRTIQRPVNDRFGMPSGEFFTVELVRVYKKGR